MAFFHQGSFAEFGTFRLRFRSVHLVFKQMISRVRELRVVHRTSSSFGLCLSRLCFCAEHFVNMTSILLRTFPILVLLMTVSCSSLFFYPNREMLEGPTEKQFVHRDIEFTTSDCVQIHGWYFPPRKRPAVSWCCTAMPRT